MRTRVVPIARFVGCVVFCPGTLWAQEAFSSANGDSLGDRLGFAVAGVGDVNGDGIADLLAGAPEDDNNGANSGSARVLSGYSRAILLSFNGDSAGDQFGHAVSGCGDFNLDGVVDLLVGAPFDDNTGVDSGMARVLSGATGATLGTLNGTNAADHFGISVSAAGDVNGDGFSDLIVGTEPTNPAAGYVRLIAGNTGATIAQVAVNTAGFGRSVDGGGDFSNDGVPDYVVGATNAITVRSGTTNLQLFAATGDSVGDDFGRSVAFASDLDGDGRVDLFVGAPADDNAGTDSGSARAFTGATAAILYTVNGTAFDQLGFDVDSTLDLDQDGLTDCVAGLPFRDVGATTDAGGYRVYTGLSGATRYTVDGLANGDHLGTSVASSGLVNSDIYGDVVAGAPEADVAGADSGSVSSYTGLCYPTVSYGVGCPGVLGIPTLSWTGCPSAGLTSHLVSTNGFPNGIAIVFMSPVSTSFPINGSCFLLVAPPFLFSLAVPLDPTGSFDLPLAFPMTSVPYISGYLYTQRVNPDNTVSGGVAASTGECICL